MAMKIMQVAREAPSERQLPMTSIAINTRTRILSEPTDRWHGDAAQTCGRD